MSMCERERDEKGRCEARDTHRGLGRTDQSERKRVHRMLCL